MYCLSVTTLKMIHKNYFQRFPVPPKVKNKIKLDTNKPPDQDRKQGKISLANIFLSLRLIFLDSTYGDVIEGVQK